MFQSSRPVAGARIMLRIVSQAYLGSFNPRAPLPGRASTASKMPVSCARKFQSSRPVAGARISLSSMGTTSAPWFQSSRPVAGARIADHNGTDG